VLDRILVVDDEPVVLDFLSDVLTREGFQVSLATQAQEALELLGAEPHDLVLCDIRMPGMDGFELLRSVVRRHPGTDVILMTGHASVDGAIDALTLGAADYLIKPLKPKEIEARIRACLERRRLEAQIHSLRSELRSRYQRHNIVASSPRMTAVVAALHRVAGIDQPVLLCGETGSGRHFLARAIHHASARRDEPIAEFDCDQTPPRKAGELLFGRSASGGRRQPGQLERLAGGTLLLAEFQHLSPEVQREVGRALTAGLWRASGESEDRDLRTRLLFSTSIAAGELISSGKIVPELSAVADLVTIHVPPLRERGEDLPGLVRAWIDEYAVEHGRMLEVPSQTLDLLSSWSFEGNVRQLELVLGHAATLSSENVLGPDVVGRALERDAPQAAGTGRICDHLDEREYQLVLRAVQRYPRRLDEAARELGVSRTTLWRRMRKYEIRLPGAASDDGEAQ
jgi:two-component system response regulator HydG